MSGDRPETALPELPPEPGRPGAARRTVLTGAGAVGAVGVVAALAGCNTDPDAEPPAPPPTGGAPDDPPDNSDNGNNGDNGDNSDNGDDGDALAEAGDIEVGGGVVLASENVVVTQPSAGDFKGFSATCTHLGCTLARVANGLIECDCHQSRFSIEDGSVVQHANTLPAGSNQNPLPEVAVREENGRIVRA